jgi:outer membrane receptor protein involved in Fe transport
MLPQRHCCRNLAIATFFTFAAQTVQAVQADLAELSLEQLMAVEVSPASKYSQRTGDAPSAVQVTCREDIQLHGWRTLTEALASLPGMYTNNHRAYDFLGARGFQVPGDYNTRFLLLLCFEINRTSAQANTLTFSSKLLKLAQKVY